MGNMWNIAFSLFILYIKSCYGNLNDCLHFPGTLKSDKIFLQNVNDQDLQQLDKCLLKEYLVLRIYVYHSNITLTALVSALSERVKHNTTIISINNCDMEKIPSGVLTTLPSLLEIQFTNNSIKELEENSFNNLPMLTTINLSYNFLTQIKARTFSNLRTLYELVLEGNKLMFISSDAFMNLPALDVLYMDYNDLQDIPYSAFRNSPIKYWHIAGNRIKEISSEIENFPYLTKFDIRDNNLQSINKNISTLHNLIELHICRNNLSTLPEEIATLVNKKDFRMELGNNPWHCDCELLWLISKVKDGLSKEELLCTTPKNISMDQLDTSSFDCKPDRDTERQGYTILPVILSAILVVGGVVTVLTLYFLKNRTRRIKKPIKMIMNGQYYRPMAVVDSADSTISTNILQYTTFEISDRQKRDTSGVGCTETKLFGRLRLGNLIGRGAFGDVFEGFASDANSVWRKVAVKKIRERGIFFPSKRLVFSDDHRVNKGLPVQDSLLDNATKEETDMLISEYQTLTDSGKHQNIIQVLGTGEINGSLIMVLEFADNGDLLAHLKTLERTNHKVIQNLDSSEWNAYLQNTHPRLFLYMWHIAKGMEYLSRMKIIHRDLAGRNILLSSEHVAKISDFGLSRDVYENGYYYQNTNGRMPYKWMSPESLFSGQYTTKSDVWSFGILLWEIVTLGANPYPGIPPDMLQNMYKHNYIMPSPPLCPDYIYSIMEECWSFLPEKRPEFGSLMDTFDKLLQTVVNKEYMDVFQLEGKEECVSIADNSVS